MAIVKKASDVNETKPDNGPTNKEKLVQKDSRGLPAGRPVGKTSGLGVTQTWVSLFERNEKAAKASRLNDTQITAAMKSDFPGRESKVFNNIQGVRGRYNKGFLTGGTAPAVQSHRYVEGIVSDPQRGVKATKPAVKKVTSASGDSVKPAVKKAPKAAATATAAA